MYNYNCFSKKIVHFYLFNLDFWHYFLFSTEQANDSNKCLWKLVKTNKGTKFQEAARTHVSTEAGK